MLVWKTLKREREKKNKNVTNIINDYTYKPVKPTIIKISFNFAVLNIFDK